MAGRPIGTGGVAEELKREEIKRIDRCLTGTRHEYRNRALFYLGLGTGMRIGEIVNLRIKDVMNSSGQILNRIVLEKHSTKSNKSRTVAVSQQAVTYLRRYNDSREPKPTSEDPLFPSQAHSNKSMSATNAILILKKMFLAAGVENASSHSLRRTHANTLRRQGVDLKIIKEQLGHSSLAITDRYFQIDPIEQNEAVNQLKY